MKTNPTINPTQTTILMLKNWGRLKAVFDYKGLAIRTENTPSLEGYIDFVLTGHDETDLKVLKYCWQKKIPIVVVDNNEAGLRAVERAHVTATTKSIESPKEPGFSFTYVDPDGETTIDMIKDCNGNLKEYDDNYHYAQSLCDEIPRSYIYSGDTDNVVYRHGWGIQKTIKAISNIIPVELVDMSQVDLKNLFKEEK